ncbi:uncharacterized protein LOC125652039 [Ostrea edulis]|uniref:uncharacterized protein LOC125652039 n=1 Tax=Ostrea edulis TaxID=37623 RepID=UPI002094F78F|nr:uncharacterized protein LOC125652039 [Ostrea edulis]
MEGSLAVALLVAMCFATGNALSCIECNSVNDKECGDPFTANQEKYLVSCEPNEKYCGKTVSTENTRMPPLVKRSCVEDRSNVNYTWDGEGCKEMNQLTTCYCDSSRCNSSDRGTLCLLLLGLSSMFVYFIRKNY